MADVNKSSTCQLRLFAGPGLVLLIRLVGLPYMYPGGLIPVCDSSICRICMFRRTYIHTYLLWHTLTITRWVVGVTMSGVNPRSRYNSLDLDSSSNSLRHGPVHLQSGLDLIKSLAPDHDRLSVNSKRIPQRPRTIISQCAWCSATDTFHLGNHNLGQSGPVVQCKHETM